MKILVVGAGPAGLSFATLMAEAERRAQVTVIERGAASEEPGWGVTLRDNALSFLGLGDPSAMKALEGRAFFHRGERVVDLPNPATHLVTVSRAELTRILGERSARAGVDIVYETDGATLSDADLARYDVVVGADGANSGIRRRFAEAFGPTATQGDNEYAWLATPATFSKLTILLRDEEVPLLAWAYGYSENRSTFIVECSAAAFASETSFRGPADGCCRRIAEVFESELGGQPVLHGPAFRWQRFAMISCQRLAHRNVALVGDAAHTTHFSQGFGTMFAFDDAIALHAALMSAPDTAHALESYEASQRPKIENFQATSAKSMRWAEQMVAAGARRDDRAVRDLIAARWSNNEVTQGPLDDFRPQSRSDRPAEQLGPGILDGALRGYRLTQLVHVVAKLGVPDALIAGPRTAGEIALDVGADPGALHRLLRVLVDVGVFTQTADNRFGLGEDGQLLRSDVEGSLRPAAIMYGESWWWGAWGGLFEAVRTGRTAFDQVHGVGLFDYLASNAEAAQLFHASMGLMTAAQADAVAAGWDFSTTQQLIDIGGGEGALVRAILALHRHVSAVVFDRPLAVEGARKRLAALASEGRCDFVVGDFFVEVPAGGDTYTLKDIVHDWDDDRAIAILRTVRRAMADSGRLLVIERVLPPGATPSPAKFVDLSMLVLTGGRERTEAAYRDLLERAGFTVNAVVAVSDEISVLEAIPV